MSDTWIFSRFHGKKRPRRAGATVGLFGNCLAQRQPEQAPFSPRKTFGRGVSLLFDNALQWRAGGASDFRGKTTVLGTTLRRERSASTEGWWMTISHLWCKWYSCWKRAMALRKSSMDGEEVDECCIFVQHLFRLRSKWVRWVPVFCVPFSRSFVGRGSLCSEKLSAGTFPAALYAILAFASSYFAEVWRQDRQAETHRRVCQCSEYTILVETMLLILCVRACVHAKKLLIMDCTCSLSISWMPAATRSCCVLLCGAVCGQVTVKKIASVNAGSVCCFSLWCECHLKNVQDF